MAKSASKKTPKKITPAQVLKLYTDYTESVINTEFSRDFDSYKSEFFAEEEKRTLKRHADEYKLTQEVDVVKKDA